MSEDAAPYEPAPRPKIEHDQQWLDDNFHEPKYHPNNDPACFDAEQFAKDYHQHMMGHIEPEIQRIVEACLSDIDFSDVNPTDPRAVCIRAAGALSVAALETSK